MATTTERFGNGPNLGVHTLETEAPRAEVAFHDFFTVVRVGTKDAHLIVYINDGLGRELIDQFAEELELVAMGLRSRASYLGNSKIVEEVTR